MPWASSTNGKRLGHAQALLVTQNVVKDRVFIRPKQPLSTVTGRLLLFTDENKAVLSNATVIQKKLNSIHFK